MPLTDIISLRNESQHKNQKQWDKQYLEGDTEGLAWPLETTTHQKKQSNTLKYKREKASSIQSTVASSMFG